MELILRKNFISTTMLLMPLLMLFFFFFVMCPWLVMLIALWTVISRYNISRKLYFIWNVNKAITEHLVNLYKKIVLGYRLHAYDGHKSLCTTGPFSFPSKEFQISLLGEDDINNTQRFLNQIGKNLDITKLEICVGVQHFPSQEFEYF